jgi:hypothetical protein
MVGSGCKNTDNCIKYSHALWAIDRGDGETEKYGTASSVVTSCDSPGANDLACSIEFEGSSLDVVAVGMKHCRDFMAGTFQPPHEDTKINNDRPLVVPTGWNGMRILSATA